jgi:integrase
VLECEFHLSIEAVLQMFVPDSVCAEDRVVGCGRKRFPGAGSKYVYEPVPFREPFDARSAMDVLSDGEPPRVSRLRRLVTSDATHCGGRLSRPPEHYDHETYERIVEGARQVDPRVHALILLAGDGGLRRGERIGLDLLDVDFKAERFTPIRSVYWKKSEKHEDVVKGDLAKPVPCTERLLEALKAGSATFVVRGRSTRTMGAS